MYCRHCGREIPDYAQACPQCGYPTDAPVQVVRRQEGLAVASLVLGIAGFVVCPVVCSIVALVLGSHARNKIRDDPTLEGEGMAKAGIILGWVGIAWGIVTIVGLVGIF